MGARIWPGPMQSKNARICKSLYCRHRCVARALHESSGNCHPRLAPEELEEEPCVGCVSLGSVAGVGVAGGSAPVANSASWMCAVKMLTTSWSSGMEKVCTSCATALWMLLWVGVPAVVGGGGCCPGGSMGGGGGGGCGCSDRPGGQGSCCCCCCCRGCGCTYGGCCGCHGGCCCCCCCHDGGGCWHNCCCCCCCLRSSWGGVSNDQGASFSQNHWLLMCLRLRRWFSSA